MLHGDVFAAHGVLEHGLIVRFLAQVGYVPAENLVGRAEMLFFSVDGSARWWEVWRWPGAIRYSRLFQGVDLLWPTNR